MSKYHHLYDILGGDMVNLHNAQEKFGKEIHPDTIESIYRLKWQEELKRATYRLCQETTMRKIYQQYLSKKAIYETKASGASEEGSNVLVNLAKAWKIPPCFIARIVLRMFYVATIVSEERRTTSSSASISEIDDTTTFASIKSQKDDTNIKTFVRKALEDPMHILGGLDPFLAMNVKVCVLSDDICSPKAEYTKQLIGAQKEQELIQKLRSLKISFMMEKCMRNLGFPKTPDVLLSVPIAIDGTVINWVESKAFFGDPYQHDRYLKKQYWAYHNRFGPGLVVYWFGYVHELATPLLQQSGILLRSSMDGFDRPGAITRIEPIGLPLPLYEPTNEEPKIDNGHAQGNLQPLLTLSAPPGFSDLDSMDLAEKMQKIEFSDPQYM